MTDDRLVALAEAHGRTAVLNGAGGPGALRLEVFGELVLDAFGAMPYLVGTAATGKAWRDVDVRVILRDRHFRRLFGEGPGRKFAHSPWGVVSMAFSALGQQLTGLPIDFQVQPQSEANKFDGPRIPIGIAHPGGGFTVEPMRPPLPKEAKG